MKSNKSKHAYHYTTEPIKLECALIDVKNILLECGYENLSDLEKLHLIHEAVFSYDRNYIDGLRLHLKRKK